MKSGCRKRVAPRSYFNGSLPRKITVLTSLAGALFGSMSKIEKAAKCVCACVLEGGGVLSVYSPGTIQGPPFCIGTLTLIVKEMPVAG